MSLLNRDIFLWPDFFGGQLGTVPRPAFFACCSEGKESCKNQKRLFVVGGGRIGKTRQPPVFFNEPV